MHKFIFVILLTTKFILFSAFIANAKGTASDAQALYEFGTIYYENGDMENAKKSFSECLNIDPDFEKAKQYLILIEREQKKTTNNIKEENAAADNTPKIAPKTEKGAWVIPKGKLYAEIYNKYYWHKSQFDDGANRIEWAYTGRYREFRSELKLEYGLSDKLTILTYLPFKEAHWKDDFKESTTRNLVDI